MNLTVRSVGRHGARLTRPSGPEEQENAGSHSEEHVAARLLPDLAQRHNLAVEMLRPIEIRHIQDGFKDSRDLRGLVSKTHDSLLGLLQAWMRKSRSPRASSHMTSTLMTREAGEPR
jgi:hypothetical protein